MGYGMLLLVVVFVVLLIGAVLFRGLIRGAGSQAGATLMFLLSVVFACAVLVGVAWVLARCDFTPPRTGGGICGLGAVALVALSLWFLFGKTANC